MTAIKPLEVTVTAIKKPPLEMTSPPLLLPRTAQLVLCCVVVPVLGVEEEEEEEGRRRRRRKIDTTDFLPDTGARMPTQFLQNHPTEAFIREASKSNQGCIKRIFCRYIPAMFVVMGQRGGSRSHCWRKVAVIVSWCYNGQWCCSNSRNGTP